LQLTSFNSAGNNLDVGIAGNLKVKALQVSSTFVVELTGSPNGYSPSGAVSIDSVCDYSTQLALSGPQFQGLNNAGTKLLINNFYGASVNIIQAVNSLGNCDFSLSASGPGQPSSFTIAGGATYFTTPVDSFNCNPFSPRIIIGLSGLNAGNCGFCHTAIYPGQDSFNFLGTPSRRWNSIYTNQAYSNAFNVMSDVRAKENLVPLTNALEKIKTLDAYYYNLKQKHDGHEKVSERKKTIGLLSQQVEKVFPEVVKEDAGYLHLDYSKLVAVLVESTKELSEKVDKQENIISELTGTVKNQQQQIELLTSLVSSLSSTASTQETLIKKLMNKN